MQTDKIDNRAPIEINISIASATDAIEYWLRSVVFQTYIKVKRVSFNEKKHFTIEFDRIADNEKPKQANP